MRAIEMRETGGPEVMALVEREDPAPGEGEVLVDVAAAGVNFIDLHRRGGRFPFPMPLPTGLGEEGAGVVTAVGPGAGRFAPGDRVAWTSVLGSYASRVVVPEDKAVTVPDAVDLRSAAAALVQGMTAHVLVHDSYPARKGDTVLVHAAAGGVGLFLVQMLAGRGVRVIGTVSTEEKARLARRHGADEVLRYGTPGGLAARVRALTGGEGVHAVYDGVGADTVDAGLDSLRTRGTLVVFGAASGPVPPVDVMRLLTGGSLTVTRPFLAHFLSTTEEFERRAGAVLGAIAEGSLRAVVGGTYPLAGARRAHADLAARRSTGKLLLVP